MSIREFKARLSILLKAGSNLRVYGFQTRFSTKLFCRFHSRSQPVFQGISNLVSSESNPRPSKSHKFNSEIFKTFSMAGAANSSPSGISPQLEKFFWNPICPSRNIVFFCGEYCAGEAQHIPSTIASKLSRPSSSTIPSSVHGLIDRDSAMCCRRSAERLPSLAPCTKSSTNCAKFGTCISACLQSASTRRYSGVSMRCFISSCDK